MSEIISIPLSSRREFPVPEAGLYGEGFEVEADVELSKLVWAPEGRYPGYDKEGEFRPYLQFFFCITPVEGPKYHLRDLASAAPNSDSKAIPWLEAAKVPHEIVTNEKTGEQEMLLDLQQAAPRKLGGIEVAGPNKGADGRTYHGNILRVIGKE